MISDEPLTPDPGPPTYTGAAVDGEHWSLTSDGPPSFSELEDLRRWKAEAMIVLAEWETVWLAAGCPGPLGSSKARAVARFIDDLLCAEDGA